MDKEDLGEALTTGAGVGCGLLSGAFGCLVQIGAAVIGLAFIIGMLRACTS